MRLCPSSKPNICVQTTSHHQVGLAKGVGSIHTPKVRSPHLSDKRSKLIGQGAIWLVVVRRRARRPFARRSAALRDGLGERLDAAKARRRTQCFFIKRRVPAASSGSASAPASNSTRRSFSTAVIDELRSSARSENTTSLVSLMSVRWPRMTSLLTSATARNVLVTAVIVPSLHRCAMKGSLR